MHNNFARNSKELRWLGWSISDYRRTKNCEEEPNDSTPLISKLAVEHDSDPDYLFPIFKNYSVKRHHNMFLFFSFLPNLRFQLRYITKILSVFLVSPLLAACTFDNLESIGSLPYPQKPAKYV